MAVSAREMARLMIVDVKAAVATITVDPTDTNTDLYWVLASAAAGIEIFAEQAERTKYSLSFLGARKQHLDNIVREINVKRLPGETDDSLRQYGPMIFNADDEPTALIDPDAAKDENPQLANVEILSEEEYFNIMVSKYASFTGDYSPLPLFVARIFRSVAQRLGWLSRFQQEVVAGYIPEDAKYLSGTHDIYRFAARRIPGVRDAAVRMGGYNRITIWVLVDSRPSTDPRGRRIVYEPSKVLEMVRENASHYLPPADRRTLSAPSLDVWEAVQAPVRVKAVYSGSAAPGDVQEALADYFYNQAAIGAEMAIGGLLGAAQAVSGVTSFAMSTPGSSDLIPGPEEVLTLGAVDLTQV